jgi:hypothetical protein
MAPTGVHGKRTPKDRVEVQCKVTADRRHRCLASRLAVLVANTRDEGHVAGQRLVRDDAERVDVGGWPRGVSRFPLFGRLVLRGAYRGIAGGELVDPEVEQLGKQPARALDHHDARRAQVAMNDPAIVRELDHLCEAVEERRELCQRHRPMPLKPLFEHDASRQLHRDPC